MPIERKLAAIMFTDIAGYTEQMSTDQDLAFVLLEEKQSKFKPLIKEHNGTLIKEMGDGTLSQYPTAVDASKCSVELQKLIQDNDKLNVRVGIHLGDTLFKDGDVFGDGVNIAARLESMSPAGGILVSKNVYDELLSHQGFEGVSLGLQTLKGVGRLVEVYALKGKHLVTPNPKDYQDTKIQVHKDEEVPSIAIIPFENKGADEDVFYAYGISADLISDCSGAGLIRVAGLKDIEKLDYSSMKYEELAKTLFVRYIAQGTLWKMGNMFQLSVELYDTKKMKVVWSDRWQENWDNISNIKSSLSEGLLQTFDKKNSHKSFTHVNPEAYELYLKATYKYNNRKDIEDIEVVRGLLERALKIDANCLKAKLLLGNTFLDKSFPEKAQKLYQETKIAAEECNDQELIGMSIQSIGNVNKFNRKIDDALIDYKSANEIFNQINSKKLLQANLNSIAGIYYLKRNSAKVLEYLDKSTELLMELEDKRPQGINLNNKGLIYQSTGNFVKALAFHMDALLITKEVNDIQTRTECYNNIAIVHYILEDYIKSKEFYFKALKIRQNLKDKIGQGRIFYNLGKVFMRLNEFEQAYENFKQCTNIFERLNLDNFEVESKIFKAFCNKMLNKDYSIDKFKNLNGSEMIDFEASFYFFKLAQKDIFIENAYDFINKKSNSFESEFKQQYLKLEKSKQIISEWEIKNNKSEDHDSNKDLSDLKSELKKYKMLFDEGLITEDDYNNKKNKLLGL